MQKSLALIIAALLIVPGGAAAQVCRGGVDFSLSDAQGQASVEVDNNSTVFGIAGGKGGQRWYGMGTLSVRTYSEREGSTFVLGFGGGRVFQHRLTRGVHHCLELRGEFGTGPDANGPVRADQSSSAMTFEFVSGLPLSGSRGAAITPFLGLALRYASVVTQGDLTSVADKDFYELVTAGVGFTLNGIYAVQPYVQLPLSRDRNNSDPIFGVRASLNIGTRN